MRRKDKARTLLAAAAVTVAAIGLTSSVAAEEAEPSPLAFYATATRAALANAGFELETMETSAGQMAYWEAGEGPTLILLHGAGDQAGAFQGVIAGLLEEHRVLIPDIPGHGDSEPAEGPLKMTWMAAGVEEFLLAHGGEEPVVLIGSSMGGWIALIQALRHPDRVARVVGINSGGLESDRPDLSLTPPDREAARTLMAALRDESSPPLLDFVLDDLVKRTASGPIGRMSAEWDDLENHLLEGRLGEIDVPVDLVWGESDQLLTLAYAERMKQGLPRARLTTIEKCGHHPANECPGKLARVLAEVLALDPPGPRPAVVDSAEETE